MKSFSTYDDGMLVSLMGQGEEGAFTELYDRYWKKLLVRAFVLLNNHEDAEEVVHDVFVSLWRKRSTLRIEHTIKTYLSAVLQYECFKKRADRVRKKAKQQLLPLLADADDSTRDYLQFEDLQKQLEAAVLQLPEQCRLVFRLSREEGLSDKQIAEELDLSVHTVRTHKHRALQKLKTSLHSFFVL